MTHCFVVCLTTSPNILALSLAIFFTLAILPPPSPRIGLYSKTSLKLDLHLTVTTPPPMQFLLIIIIIKLGGSAKWA